MSAYLVAKASIDDLVTACVYYGIIDRDAANMVGDTLWSANAAAMAYRYDEAQTEVAYTFEPTPAHPGQWARSLTNYLYQCVDHPAWKSFEAREICVQLALALVQEVPGYREAEGR